MNVKKIPTIVIKFYDNEKYDYPMIEIIEGYLENLKSQLKAYQLEDGYNYDDFIKIIQNFHWFIREIIPEEIFF